MRVRRMRAPMPRVALVHDFLLDLRGRRARLRRDLRRLAGGRRLHRGLRRGGHRGALRRARPAGLVPAAAAADRRAPSAPLLPLYPHAIESLDLRGYDIVISSSSARGRTACWSTPARRTSATATTRSATRGASARRRWPRATRSPARRCARCCRAGASGTGSPPSASTPTSPTRRVTAARIRRYFGRESTVLHPPVELSRFSPGPVGRALPGAGRADGAQAHRRRDPRVQRARRCRWWWSGTGRSGAGCGGSRARPCA